MKNLFLKHTKKIIVAGSIFLVIGLFLTSQKSLGARTQDTGFQKKDVSGTLTTQLDDQIVNVDLQGASLVNVGSLTASSTQSTTGTFAYITTPASNTNLQITPNGTGITQIGDAGTTSRALVANDDLFVSGKFEVDSIAYFDNNVQTSDGSGIFFGVSNDEIIHHNVVQTPDSFFMGIGLESKSLIIADTGNRTFDFAHPLQTSPTVFIHSSNASTTQWLGLTHTSSTGLITTGLGSLTLLPFASSTIIGDAGSTSQALTANDDLFVSGKFEVDGTAYFDSQSIFNNAAGTQIELSFDATIGNYGGFQRSTDDGLIFIIGETNNASNNNLIFSQSSNRGKDHDHDTLNTNPTIFIHSATDPDTNNTQWLSFSHDQTDGVINVGTGALFLQGRQKRSVTTVNSATYAITATDNFICSNYSLTGNSTTTLPDIAVVGTSTIYTIMDCGGNASVNNINILASNSDTIDRVASTTAKKITTDSGSFSFIAVSSTGWKTW